MLHLRRICKTHQFSKILAVTRSGTLKVQYTLAIKFKLHAGKCYWVCFCTEMRKNNNDSNCISVLELARISSKVTLFVEATTRTTDLLYRIVASLIVQYCSLLLHYIASFKQEKETTLGTIITMLWLRPFMLYEDCPEGDSFESSPDTPLIPIDTNLASASRSTAPTATSSTVPHTANGTGTGTFHQPPRMSSSTSFKNKGKKVKKERTTLPFFNARKMKERTGAFPLLQQSKNQKVRSE
jgi:hypothetical protein